MKTNDGYTIKLSDTPIYYVVLPCGDVIRARFQKGSQNLIYYRDFNSTVDRGDAITVYDFARKTKFYGSLGFGVYYKRENAYAKSAKHIQKNLRNLEAKKLELSKLLKHRLKFAK